MKKDKETKKEKELSWIESVRYIDFNVKMSWDEDNEEDSED